MPIMSRQLFIAVLTIAWIAATGSALAVGSAERVFQELTPSVVEIATLESWGSGLLVDRDGLVLTNRHVAGPLPVYFIRASGRRGPDAQPETRNFHAVRVAGVHVDRDLILLKIDAPGWTFDAVSMGSPAAVRAGMDCHAIGTPTGSRQGTATTHSITSGIVSAVGVDLPGGPFIQTTTPVNPGNSGGPLCDADGNVIGVVTARLEGADSIAFAIPWAGISRADFKEPEPVAGPAFDELELRAQEAARLADGESGRNRLAYLRDELQARRAQLAFANPPPVLIDRLIELWIESGETASAARMVDFAHALDPERALTGFGRGHVAWAEGRRAEALDHWLETIGRHDPADVASRGGVGKCLVGCGVVLRTEGRLSAAWYAFHSAAAMDPAVRGMNGWPADFDELAAEVAADLATEPPLAGEDSTFSMERLRRLMGRTPATDREDRFAGPLTGNGPPAANPPAGTAREIATGLPTGAANIRLQNPPPGVALGPDGSHLRVDPLPHQEPPGRVLILFEIDGKTRYQTLEIPAP